MKLEVSAAGKAFKTVGYKAVYYGQRGQKLTLVHC